MGSRDPPLAQKAIAQANCCIAIHTYAVRSDMIQLGAKLDSSWGAVLGHPVMSDLGCRKSVRLRHRQPYKPAGMPLGAR